MYLKRIEIQGFKSFHDKIKLEFKSGITAIVGPNGSGKSNISDAMRWVLGEQSAKTLRGDKMEDIIFAGTKNRKPLGFAEVSMIIDNGDRLLDVDYSEIKITRKVYRSGESAYYINGTPCRLKDIHELFMDTGIGREGYSIIGQGRIDSILSTRSEDRRALFEEAAGIVKFKTRRSQAENKLEDVKKNLLRTNDIISELEKQVDPLREQAEKTKRYNALAEERKNLRLDIFCREYEKAEIFIAKAEKDIEAGNEQIKNERKIKDENEANQIDLKEKLKEIEEKAEENNEKKTALEIADKENENQIKIKENNIEFILKDIKRIKDEIKEGTEERTKKENDINNINIANRARIMEKEQNKRIADKMQSEFDELNSKLSESEERIKEYNDSLIEKMRQASGIEADIKIKSALIEQYEVRLENSSSEMEITESKLDEKNTRLKVLQKEKSNIEEKEKNFNEKIDLLEKSIKEIVSEKEKTEKVKSECENKINDFRTRYKLLSDLEKDYTGYYDSVRAVLKQHFDGVCGAVGELITVGKEYETAIETALGSTIQNIVTQSEEDAKKAIEYLKVNQKGRATFLPLTSVNGREIDENVKKDPDIIGIASDLTRYDEKYRKIILSILGRVIIADDLDTAIKLSRRYKNMYKIVTLDGQQINAGGSMTGGSISKKSGRIFSRGREIKEIEENIRDHEVKLVEYNNELLLKNEKIEEINEESNDIKEHLQDLVIQKNNKINQISQEEDNIRELTQRYEAAKKDRNELGEVIENEKRTERELGSSLDAIKKEIDEINQKLEEHNSLVESDKDGNNERLRRINEINMKLVEIENQIKANERDIERIKSEISSISDDIEKKNGNIDRLESDKSAYEEGIKEIREKLDSSNALYEKIKGISEELAKQKIEVSERIDSYGKELMYAVENISRIENEIARIEERKISTEEKNTQLCNSIWEDYEVTYAQAAQREKSELSDEERIKREKKIRNEIASLGNINANAIEEYNNIKKRYELNITQREDILKADNDLRDIIRQLTEDMEKQFEEQFRIINKNFSIVFSEIFGGGTANLRLVDENDILHSGIEIDAQPPGKALQRLTLLSGGEKALTAMSLLFAILRMKPSPFSILDEIEAALDDANVVRYANYLKKFADKNQFIVITHKTGTMEVSDVLYGVTMEEQGVSKIVSVKLNEAEKMTNKEN